MFAGAEDGVSGQGAAQSLHAPRAGMRRDIELVKQPVLGDRGLRVDDLKLFGRVFESFQQRAGRRRAVDPARPEQPHRPAGRLRAAAELHRPRAKQSRHRLGEADGRDRVQHRIVEALIQGLGSIDQTGAEEQAGETIAFRDGASGDYRRDRQTGVEIDQRLRRGRCGKKPPPTARRPDQIDELAENQQRDSQQGDPEHPVEKSVQHRRPPGPAAPR